MTEDKFPRPQPDDADDVVLALSTGSSLWASGDKAEAIRWLRKAQEAADAAGSDLRSVALARAAAELTEVQDQAEETTSEEPVEEVRPQLTKPPMPPASPKTRLETPRAKSSSNGSSNGVGGGVENGNGHAPVEDSDLVTSGPILTQALRVCIKRSVRDDELFVARLLEDGEVPAGYHEALVVLTDPDQDLLDKLS